MENKKIDVLFGVVVIAFLVVTIVLIKDFKAQRSNDFNEYKAAVVNIVRMKNDRIKILSGQLAVKQKENEGLNNALSETRNDLEMLSRKLAQPIPTAAPASAPAPEATTK